MPARLETYNLLERFGVATVLHLDLLAQTPIGPGKAIFSSAPGSKPMPRRW